MKRRLPARKAAEWLTLVVSAATILALIGYLVFELNQPASPFVDLVATAAPEEAQRVGERYVLPIDVENRGARSVSRAVLRITIAGAKGDEQEDIQLEYLARSSTKRIYKYLQHDPRSAKVTIVPGHYTLD